jgi:hypothetical protein
MRLAAFAFGSLLVLGLAPARAQATPQTLAGLWRRLPTQEAPDARYFRLAATADGLAGDCVNPPEGIQYHVALALKDGKLTGKATLDDSGSKVDVAWDLTVKDADHLDGRSEYVMWNDDGSVAGRGWEPHGFERVARVGLVTDQEGAEEPYGDPIDDLPALAGGWAGPGGAWALAVDRGKATLTPVGHHDGLTITLGLERGALRGTVTTAGQATKVELALSEGKLEGRAEWVAGADLGDAAERGWAPVALTRLPRTDGSAAGAAAAAAPEPPEAGAAAPLDGVWRRDDGLFVRLHPEGGAVVGVLSDADGVVKARLHLEAKDGRFVGAANWDGVEARWELSATSAGLVGRCEWVDAADGRVVSRGWLARTFSALRRVS